MSTTLSTTQDTVWENRAMQCINGLLPASIDRKELQKAIWELEDCGPEKLSTKSSNLINQVLAYQSGSEEHQSLPTEDEPESAQEAPHDFQLGEGTREIENAPQSQPEATEAKVEDSEGDDEREELQKEERSLKRMIKMRKTRLNLLRKTLPKKQGEEKIAMEAEIASLEEDIQKREEELPKVREQRLSLAPVVTPDEEQPWFGRVYANCTGYIIKNTDGTFKTVNKDIASTYLRGLGISQERDTHTTSPLDRALLAIHDRHSVDMAIALAGYQPGLRDLGNSRILITKGPALMKPEPGEFPIIQQYLNGMLKDQVSYIHSWQHLAVKPLYDGRITKSLALFLAGPINTGKSVFQNLIVTPLLGRRVARPYAFMAGRTDFNEEWFECEHLMFEDEASRDYDDQQRVAAATKNLIANDVQWCHGKGKKALSLPPFWRFTASVNEKPEYLRLIPVNDETLKDKILVLKAFPEATVKLVDSLGGQEAFAEAIKEELPAYLYWLLNVFEIPEELRDTRFGMKAYQNPEIVEAVEETAPHVHLLEFMRKTLYPAADGLEKTVLDIYTELHDCKAPKGVLPANPNTLGKYLSSISEIVPKQVQKKRTKKGIIYTLKFFGNQETDKAEE